jgi:hypothetical protein
LHEITLGTAKTLAQPDRFLADLTQARAGRFDRTRRRRAGKALVILDGITDGAIGFPAFQPKY